MTAGGHESGEGYHVTANGHDDLPDEQGNANAVGATGSGQKTATGHIESGLGETGIDPRIVTGLPESEGERDTTGSGPKTATSHAVTASGWTAIETSPASDAPDRLTASCKQSESENDGAGHEEAARAGGARCERATSPFPAPEGAEEAEARSRAPDERPVTLPPLSLDQGQAGGEEASGDAAQGAPPDPSSLACPPEGREEEEASGRKTSEKVPARGELASAVGSAPEGREERFQSS